MTTVIFSEGLLENQLNGFKKPKKEEAESTTLASWPPASICLVRTVQNCQDRIRARALSEARALHMVNELGLAKGRRFSRA